MRNEHRIARLSASCVFFPANISCFIMDDDTVVVTPFRTLRGQADDIVERLRRRASCWLLLLTNCSGSIKFGTTEADLSMSS
jgi:hypothetical protein